MQHALPTTFLIIGRENSLFSPQRVELNNYIPAIIHATIHYANKYKLLLRLIRYARDHRLGFWNNGSKTLLSAAVAAENVVGCIGKKGAEIDSKQSRAHDDQCSANLSESSSATTGPKSKNQMKQTDKKSKLREKKTHTRHSTANSLYACII